ncbi:MAG: anaerobic sulfatase-maturation protein [Bacteroidota bacterium]|nr:MAG: anaerobic sulfatase-maturation protein [Bacteroidota bacterium]
MESYRAKPTLPIYLLTKSVGSVCNLNCTYCYYLEKEKLYPKDPQRWFMNDKVLSQFVAQYIYLSVAPAVLFTWHGGEATLRGMDFYKKAFELQKKFSNGKKIENILQTNGTTLTDDWCKFFKDNNFLIGISIDGPEHCHDRYRRNKGNQPSFAKVMHGLELLQKHGVEFNTLSVVNDYNAKFPEEVYRFLKSIGSRYMQFTPIVEAVDINAGPGELKLQHPGTDKEAEVTDWTVDPIDYGDFLIKIFDEWVRKDVGDYYVVTFDCILANWLGVPPPLCIYAETCGNSGAVEFNGDVYSCDHYVFPEFKLGNIMNGNLMDMMQSPFQKEFGRNKRDALPAYCRKCDYVKLCNGECPKNRIINTPEGEPGLNYLCAGFKKFYKHTAPYFEFMANEISSNRAASNVRQWAKER